MIKEWYYTIKRLVDNKPIFKIEDKYDSRDYIAEPRVKAGVTEIDLSPFVPEKKTQDKGSCGSHSGLSLIELEVGRQRPSILSDPFFKGKGFSEMFHYYWARKMNGSFPADGGMSVMETLKTIQKYGLCPEAVHPDVWSNFNTAPNQFANESAEIFKKYIILEEYSRILDVSGLQKVLLSGKPAVIGIKIWDGFYYNRSGEIPMPVEGKERYWGGHAILIVGYKNNKFKLLNSWGTGWGNSGFAWISRDYLEKYNLGMATADVRVK